MTKTILIGFFTLFISNFTFGQEEVQFNSSTESKIDLNAQQGKSKYDGIKFNYKLIFDSKSENSDATYFLDKMSNLLTSNFNLSINSIDNVNNNATILMNSDDYIVLEEIKIYVTQLGYRVNHISGNAIIK